MTTMENQLGTRWGRVKTWLDALFVDHAVFRLGWRNFHRVADGVYRSNNPLPYQVRRAAKKGIRTIVNLRGPNRSSWYYLEEEACARSGIELVSFRVKSRDAPEKEMLHGAKELFGRLTYPVMFHCKSGADRASLISVLYLILEKNLPVADAVRQQMSLRYLHFKSSKTGILDHFFETYLADTKDRPMAFMDWVDQVYDPEALRASFKPGIFGRTIGDIILRRE